MGQRISVDGEVEEIYGPTLFTIDEPHWGDLDGEILVHVPTPLAALVKDNDRVTISGTVKPFVRAELEREWGWLGLDGEVDADVSIKPVLVAERLIGGDSNTALVIDGTSDHARRTGTSTGVHAITDGATLGSGDHGLVGRRISLDNVRVTGNASRSGFFIDVGNRHIFVLPAKSSIAALALAGGGGEEATPAPASSTLPGISQRYIGCIGPTANANMYLLSVLEGQDFTTGEPRGTPIPQRSSLPEGAPPPIAPVTVRSGTPGGGPTPTTQIVTYRLVGNDLQQYVGHTVAVLGRAERTGENDARSSAAEPSALLYVTSIRDIANHCK